jgi:hypothetical protein
MGVADIAVLLAFALRPAGPVSAEWRLRSEIPS